ncbi:MAG: 3'(2'),5'-bisphosphate nucleotidase CysQ [Saprospiraceae bacterium]
MFDSNSYSLDNLAPVVGEVARAAGHAILEVYERADTVQVIAKADNSPVTEADFASNTVICAALAELEPFMPIISEENKAIPFEERSKYPAFWLVDPLDGTKEFLKRNGEFTVNIALVRGNTPVLGVVYAPVTDDLYVGYEQTAYVEKGGEKTKIQVPAFSLRDSRLTVVCSRSHLNEATRQYLASLNEPTTLSVGSSLKFLMVANGRAHIYPRLGPTSEWDTAAAQAVVEAAGGQVLEAETGTPLRYNKEELLNPYFIVYGQVRD